MPSILVFKHFNYLEHSMWSIFFLSEKGQIKIMISQTSFYQLVKTNKKKCLTCIYVVLDIRSNARALP
jgi:hypothetical protein